MDFRLKNTLFPQYRRIHCRIYIFCYFSPIIILNHVIHYIIYTYIFYFTHKENCINTRGLLHHYRTRDPYFHPPFPSSRGSANERGKLDDHFSTMPLF